MRIDGKKIAEDIYQELLAQTNTCSPKLGLVVCGSDSATQSFVRLKERVASRLGVEVYKREFEPDVHTEDLVTAVFKLSQEVDGLVVQLPLPGHIDESRVLSTIPKAVDVDALNQETPSQERLVHAPVAEAVLEILARASVSVLGKRTVVVGAGKLVGAPVAERLQELGAVVSVVTLETGSLQEVKEADIVVLGAGSPGLLTPDMLKPGVVLIDAGTSEAKGRVVGDADPACESVASVFTPVPGGVGPVTVSMLFKNLFAISRH